MLDNAKMYPGNNIFNLYVLRIIKSSVYDLEYIPEYVFRIIDKRIFNIQFIESERFEVYIKLSSVHFYADTLYCLALLDTRL